MQLSETVKLYMTSEQRKLISETMNVYIDTVNSLVSAAVNGVSINRYTSSDIDAALPAALKNQCIRDAKSVVRKYNRECRKAIRRAAASGTLKMPAVPVLKKPCCYINNQNFRITGNRLEFPVMMNGRSKRISVRTRMTGKQKDIFANHKLGTLRIVRKGDKIAAQVTYEVTDPELPADGKTMGIDLGIKCPAVSYTSDGSVKFYGNGRKNKYLRRRFNSLRKKLQKEKHTDALKRIGDKEQRIMKDIDHKLSREIVNTAVSYDVTIIKLERLSNIRSATRTSRKNDHSLHNWSFYRLANYIEYKATLAGIKVEYVDPAYTSQKCPVCGDVHHAKDRTYTCKCGFRIHRDILGAMNICSSTEYVGDRHVRRTA